MYFKTLSLRYQTKVVLLFRYRKKIVPIFISLPICVDFFTLFVRSVNQRIPKLNALEVITVA